MGDRVLFHADDAPPIGYGLVLGLIFSLCCWVAATALGVLGGISWISGWRWSAVTLLVGAVSTATAGAIGIAMDRPRRSDAIGSSPALTPFIHS